MNKGLIFLSSLLATIFLGCANNQQLGADVYDATQLNTKQEAKTIQIITVTPAKVLVDNKQNKQTAQTIGGILGAVGGAIIGYNVGGGSRGAGALAGGAGGGAIGLAAGSMVDDKVVVDGVTITYKENNKIYSSTQAGKVCQFKAGEIALLITTQSNETRIQPNAVCPEDKK